MKHLALLFTAALLLACHKKPATTGPLEDRLAAASGIFNAADRDEAFTHVANDAAGTKNVEVTIQAIDHIFSSDGRDKSAANCALIFAKHGETKAATIVAGKIFSADLRDKTLKSIASNQ